MLETNFHTSFSKATWDEFKADQRPGSCEIRLAEWESSTLDKTGS